MKPKIRKNIALSNDIGVFVEEQSEEYGMSQSAFINMCIKTYKDQQLAMQELSNIKEYITKLEMMIKEK